jgi:outer membrane receptor protein involved in Fe transport
MKTASHKLLKAALAGLIVLPHGFLSAQEDPAATDEEVFELNPFIVESPDEKNYTMSETLAGTRIRTDMRDIAASVSTITEFFLNDTMSTGSEDLLLFTPNTEVGGLEGNFSGLGNTGQLEEELVAPHTNTRIRGLSAADNTRDYFRTDIPWDAYNVDAVTIQRGPNSVLFGVAGPAGVINTSLKRPVFDNQYSFENMLDEFGRIRNILDLNQEIIDDELALRVIALDDDEKYRQDEAYRNTRRYFGTGTWQPQVFGEGASPLNITVTAETGEIDANMPRFTPPRDRITPFFDPEGLNRQTFHPQSAWNYGPILDRGTRVNQDYPQFWEPWLGQQIPGVSDTSLTALIDNATGSRYFQTLQAWSRQGLGPDGTVDGEIDGFTQMVRLANVAGFNEYAQNINAINPGTYPGAAPFWKDTVVTDPNVFDFYNHLIDGDNKQEWQDWDAYNVSISQTFWHNRIGVEYFYDFQELTRGGQSFYSNTLNLDVNSHLFVGPSDGPILSSWPDTLPDGSPDIYNPVDGVPNPNAGRAYVSGGDSTASQLMRERENNRLTAFIDIDSRDFIDEDSLLSWIIGRNTVTGLYQKEEVYSNNHSWKPFAADLDLIDLFPTMDASITGFNRRVPYMVYLSDDLRNANISDGLGISSVNGHFRPSGSITAGYFDPTWNAPEVDPGAPWTRPLDGEEMTQSENPANYVGWSTGNFNILSAENGDIASLYTAGSQTIEKIDSKGITWQGRLFGGHVIPTIGYREDEVTTTSQTAPQIDPVTKVVDPFFSLQGTPTNTSVNEGSLTTWGVVVRSPDFINEKIGFIDNFTLFYNESENFSAENRVGFSGRNLPSPQGTSEDYGFTVSALDGRVNLKATWYETTQEGARIAGDTPLGANQWFLANNAAWLIGHALKMEAFHRGEEIGGTYWYYNYAQPDDGFTYDASELPPDGFDHPSLAAQRDMWQAVYDNLFPQEWYDAWGFPIDVAKLQSDDWETRKQGITDPAYRPASSVNVVAMQPANGGLIRGLNPIGTVDQKSEGFELEVNAQLTPNWNVYLNASKVEATRGNVGADFTGFLNDMRALYDSPAGDIRQWWAGDNPTRQFFDDFIWAPFLFQQDSIGLQAPEIRPWRFNFVTSYEFSDGGLEGLRLGLGYRWQDDLIVGNMLNDELDNLDPNRPIYGGAESNVDIWVGYQTQLTDRITWDIQLNIKNLGENEDLIPVSVNPDGSPAAMRIQEGMRWELRNVISF